MTCPLDNTPYQSYCSLHQKFKQDNKLSHCSHQKECSQLKVDLKATVNKSALLTRIMRTGIPLSKTTWTSSWNRGIW